MWKDKLTNVLKKENYGVNLDKKTITFLLQSDFEKVFNNALYKSITFFSTKDNKKHQFVIYIGFNKIYFVKTLSKSKICFCEEDTYEECGSGMVQSGYNIFDEEDNARLEDFSFEEFNYQNTDEFNIIMDRIFEIIEKC